MNKYKQDERVYFRIKDGVEGWATVAGDYDLLIILKPEKPLSTYSHIYVTRTQVVEVSSELPKIEIEADDGL